MFIPSWIPCSLARQHQGRPQPSQSPAHRLRGLGVAVVLLFFGGLALSEAGAGGSPGATVIRISTPDGTVVVEVDDRQVKVTIEGDAGIVITGAGPQDIRLKASSYRVPADKDGKAVKKELVNISRDGKTIVKVIVEPAGAGPTAAHARLTPDEAKKIQGLYNRYCIRCHGVDGRGVWDIPKVPEFTDAAWQASRSDAEFVRAILEGRGAPEKRRDSLKLPPPSKTTGILQWAVMPPFGDILTAEEARGMARFLRIFAPSSEAPRRDQSGKPAAIPK